MAFCFGCKAEVETQNIAVQTECTDGGDAEVVSFLSPGSGFRGKSYDQIVKLQQCLGDCEGNIELFEDSELSSIEESDSSAAISFLQSFIEDEDSVGSHVEKDSERSMFENWRKKFLSPQGNLKKNYKFSSTTPRLNRFEKENEDEGIDQSYERMMNSLGGAQTEGLKESFIQLIQIEKISLRLQLQRKNYSFGKV